MLEYIKLPVQCVYFFRGATAQHHSEKWITHSSLCCSTLSLLLIFSPLSLLYHIPPRSSVILPVCNSLARTFNILQIPFSPILSPSISLCLLPCLSPVIPTLLLSSLPSPHLLPSILLACSFSSCLCLGTPSSRTAYWFLKVTRRHAASSGPTGRIWDAHTVIHIQTRQVCTACTLPSHALNI